MLNEAGAEGSGDESDPGERLNRRPEVGRLLATLFSFSLLHRLLRREIGQQMTRRPGGRTGSLLRLPQIPRGARTCHPQHQANPHDFNHDQCFPLGARPAVRLSVPCPSASFPAVQPTPALYSSPSVCGRSRAPCLGEDAPVMGYHATRSVGCLLLVWQGAGEALGRRRLKEFKLVQERYAKKVMHEWAGEQGSVWGRPWRWINELNCSKELFEEALGG
ncbi:hypothetical protein CALVIDRAFT_403877 [Calocera viscosa TUFC12733]|uniref:Uncharacterized protein n=1 Tax=Calocera viscosa (strain TUFC12733) TaxID=1330018 RepID=A0A167PV18_CALVF|nr:hypothetical protein CALVIDRAFT_403877 [Calocera viscosa TUFC12733]